MITVLFTGFLALSMTVALTDWRRGWLMALLCGVLQDPARKLTPGTPVILTLSVVAVYAVILFAASGSLQDHGREFSRRFGTVYGAIGLVFGALVLAAMRGMFTFGLSGWKAPAMSFFLYCAPVPAVLLGYAYLHREESLYRLFRFYAVITSVALIGTPLEYMQVSSRALGTVALTELNIRHLPGIQIRMLSGFYRAPDIMAWHAATLTIIAIIMIMRAPVILRAWPWMLAAAWGFFNCLLSGRRKAVYMIAVFALVFVWRYFRRLTAVHFIAMVFVVGAIAGVMHKISGDEESSVYAAGASTTRQEVMQRLEGGLVETIAQFGLLGAGLGTATQGVQHVAGTENIGWQEGGLGKLAMELGVPGLIAVVILVIAMFRMMLAIARHSDVPGSSQFTRCVLFAIVVANGVEFMVSAQAYSDAVLALLTAFFLGCLFATAVLDERLPVNTPAPAPARLTAPATA